MQHTQPLPHQPTSGAKRGIFPRWLLSLLAMANGLLTHSLASPTSVQTSSANEKPSEQDKRFAEFVDGVRAYAKLRSNLRRGIPPVHRKDVPEQIEKHQQELAARIQEARKDAKKGDLFTPASKEAFRQVINSVFSGEQARTVSHTLVQGEPVRLELFVNKPYPQSIPVTTVPPTLLQRFPKLPKDLEYRVVGSSLVLHDVESRLIVDLFTDAFPNAPPH